jgi:hypothetical protein
VFVRRVVVVILVCAAGVAASAGSAAAQETSGSPCYPDLDTIQYDHARYDCKVKLRRNESIEAGYAPCGDPRGFYAHRRAYRVSYSDYQERAIDHRFKLRDRKLRVRGAVKHKALAVRNLSPWAIYIEYFIRCPI